MSLVASTVIVKVPILYNYIKLTGRKVIIIIIMIINDNNNNDEDNVIVN